MTRRRRCARRKTRPRRPRCRGGAWRPEPRPGRRARTATSRRPREMSTAPRGRGSGPPRAYRRRRETRSPRVPRDRLSNVVMGVGRRREHDGTVVDLERRGVVGALESVDEPSEPNVQRRSHVARSEGRRGEFQRVLPVLQALGVGEGVRASGHIPVFVQIDVGRLEALRLEPRRARATVGCGTAPRLAVTS